MDFPGGPWVPFLGTGLEIDQPTIESNGTPSRMKERQSEGIRAGRSLQEPKIGSKETLHRIREILTILIIILKRTSRPPHLSALIIISSKSLDER
ncbi:galactose-3-O-sulfotransferase 3-like protein [Anopheles sinensis]|uniref:Galactose-3-O-sulfotransferase 3-like protein n=1 Tax=Anopheles sinensis TaxID=74873 RepID=A0A084VZF6_ANOSI|nr:galactose-3-O-sulfotransferase 3-like protein [Anopheles sinensis]